MTRLILVRHAESAPSDDIPEPQWPLSARGVVQARELVARLSPFAPAAIYSSPYPRAVATVQPLAEQLRLTIHTHQDLRERKLAEPPVGKDNFLPHVERSWSDLDYCLPGGESCRTCQTRVLAALTEICDRHSGQTIIAASHGNAIGLILKHLDPSFGFKEWRAMRNPDVFELSIAGSECQWVR